MILVDTSVIVAWLDGSHPHHRGCTEALSAWARKDSMAVSAVTFAELAAGARTRDGIEEDLRGFHRVPLNFDAAWRAGLAFRQYRPVKGENGPVLPDFLIRAQAACLHYPHLTSERRRLRVWPDVDFLFPKE